MLTGQPLGKAIDEARKLKKMSKAALARHFEVAPPSVQDWIKYGRIDKGRLSELFQLFADVVGPEHWGLSKADFAGVSGAGEAIAVEVAPPPPKKDPSRDAWIAIYDEMASEEEKKAALAAIRVFKASYLPPPQAGPGKSQDGSRRQGREKS